MTNRKFWPLLEALVMAGIAFGFHYMLLHLAWSSARMAGWQYDIATIYAFFILCSLIIVLVLLKVKQRNIDSVGNAFMLLTCIKAALAYVMLNPILQSNQPDVAFEKVNFFAVFAAFLAIETIVSIRMLQKK